MNAREAYAYAVDDAKRRIPGIERIILTDARYTMYYIESMIQDRWSEAENTLRRADFWWNQYLGLLCARRYNRDVKWQWVKEGLTGNLVEILNRVRMGRDIQEYICRERPDLIGMIQNLHLALKAKYGHELELAGVDL